MKNIPMSLNADRAKTMIESYAIQVFKNLEITPDMAFSVMESISLNFAKGKCNYVTNEYLNTISEIQRKESEEVESSKED